MTQSAELAPARERGVIRIPLDHLLLDPENPRFGSLNKEADQQQLLDHITAAFGIDDVLNSLAVNGYFEAEPVVCQKIPDSDEYVVVEGNRRLAACLILKGDQRAANQKRRIEKFGKLWEERDRPTIDPIPAIAFEAAQQKKAILPYLGVRHIASAQPWDSYAKAAWVAQVVESGDLNIKDVSQMIGDQHQTVHRLLEGYYLVRQLVNSGKFSPEDSIRSGRGSVTDYPFSWVYTVLGYAAVREYLGIEDSETRESVIAEDKLERGGLLLNLMFGNRTLGRNAAIEDSRQLGKLAAAFTSSEKVQLLREGKPLAEVEVLTQPVERRLEDGLGVIRETLRDLIARLSEQKVGQDVAVELIPVARGNRRMAADLVKRIEEAAGRDQEE